MDIPKPIVSELVLYADYIFIYDKYKKPKFAYLTVQHHLDEIGICAKKMTNQHQCRKKKTNAMIFPKKLKLDVPSLNFMMFI